MFTEAISFSRDGTMVPASYFCMTHTRYRVEAAAGSTPVLGALALKGSAKGGGLYVEHRHACVASRDRVVVVVVCVCVFQFLYLSRSVFCRFGYLCFSHVESSALLARLKFP